MIKWFLASLMSVGITATAAMASTAHPGEWMTNYEQALARAKSEHKKVLMDFSGSDWCLPCQRLDREVFRAKEFKDYAAKNLVLLKVDFPRRTAQPAEVEKQNMKLADQYHVEAFPTLIVLNPDGKKPVMLNYVPGTPKSLIVELKKAAPKN